MNDVRDQAVSVGGEEVDRNRRPSALEGVLRDQQMIGAWREAVATVLVGL